ncbi:hypothetical protein V6N13_040729 [Hibiscus sabdariffa]|uniref:Uncharacterized protein n=1 Tax=Hibiscus sabdariffa TaxID=183260 RepID=A0ABR2R9A8_9ROSI
MAKIALAIVLVSMVMILSAQSVVGDASTQPTTTADVKKAAVPTPESAPASSKDSSWTNWAKDKISGIENIFASSPSSGSAGAPESSPAPGPAITIKS